jgi:hypothetical protein
MKIEVQLHKIGAKYLKNKEGKKYIKIPFDPRTMDVYSAKGFDCGITLNLTAFELSKPDLYNEDKTHAIKPHIDKDTFEKMSDADKEKIPFCGSVIQWKPKEPEASAEPEVEEFEVVESKPANEVEDLPF